MPQTYGATAASSAVPRRAFRNVSAQVVSFSAGGRSYTLPPRQIVTLPKSDADPSTDIVALLISGALQELTVFGSATTTPEPTPVSSQPVTPSISFTEATQSSITGNINGIIIDGTTGLWMLADGNRLLYANTRRRQQPAPGIGSAITIGATMSRASVAGSFGFAIYTDGAPTDWNFQNGIVALYESTGLCNIYQLTAGRWNNITDRTASGFNQVPYPLDINEHAYAVVVQQPDTDTLKLTAFCDSQPVAVATLTNGQFITSGTVGFSTSSGCSPIEIASGSFEFQLGVDLRENMPIAAQHIIQVDANGNPVLNVAPSGGATGTLAQGNTDPAVVAGSVTGSAKNLVPDSDLKFFATLWNTSQAGSFSVLSGVGYSGGNGIIVSQPAGTNAAIGNLRLISSSWSVTPGWIVSLSGNIQNPGGIAGGSGLPAWEIWSLNSDGSLNARLMQAQQQLGTGTHNDNLARVKQEAYAIPTGITSVALIAAANNVALAGGTSLIFSEPQFEIGPYATAYVPNLLDESGTVPYGGLPTPIILAVNPEGQVDIGSPQPGTTLPLDANSSQVQSTISSTQNGTTYLQGQVVANINVAPSSITGSQARQAVYTNAVANTYNNVANNSNWYVPGIGPVTSSTAIPDGSSLIYSVSIADPAASPAPVQEALQIAASSTITVIFNHPSFVATAPGSTRVAFAGSQQSASSSLLQSANISDSSSPSITAVTAQNTAAQSFTKSLSDTGNPQITSSTNNTTSAQQNTQAVSDTESPAITSSSNSSTSTQPFSGNVPSTNSSPAVSSTTSSSTSAQQKTQVENNTSTPTITSSNNTTNSNQQKTSAGSVSSSPSIVPTYHANTGNTQKSGASKSVSSTSSVTQNSNTTYSNQQKSGTATAEGSQPTITKTQNATTYSTNQHTAAASGTGSQAYLWYYASGQQSASGPGGSWPTSTMTYHSRSCDDSSGKLICTTVGDGSTYSGGGSSTVSMGSYVEPPTVNTPMSITVTITSTKYNTWSVSLLRPDGTTYNTWTPTSGTAITVSDNNETQVGAWQWKLSATVLADDWDGTGSGTAGSGTAAATSTVTYYNRLTAGQYGSENTIYTTPAGTLAPTSASTQLSYAISSVSKPSDANGTSGMYIYLYDPNGNKVATFQDSQVVANGTLTYSAAGAPAGAWKWTYLTEIPTSTNQTTSNYTDTVSGTMGWYQSDANPATYTFSTSNGATQSLSTSAAALPSGASTAHSLIVSGISCPSDANGSTALQVQLYDSNGSLVNTWTITTNQTISYSTTSTAPTGTWTWKLTGIINSDAQVNGETYTVSCTAQPQWYEQVATTTYSYTTTNGASTTVTTSGATLAPTASTPITLALSNISAPSDAAGSSAFTVQLTDPNNALVQSWTGITTNQTLTCNAANGGAGTASGVYTWTIFATATSKNTGGGSYAASVSVLPQWYEANTGGTYTYADNAGAASTYKSGTATLAPTSPSLQLSLQFASVVLGSDAYGSSKFSVTLTDPNSTQVGSWSVTGATTLTYSNANAIAGQYTWTITGVVASDAHTATATSTYTDTANLTLGWYESVSTTTTSYASNNGASTSYATTGATLAPTSAAQQLTFQITAITAGSDGAGSSYYSVTLNKPDGTQAQQWTGITSTQTLSWSNASAAAGVYTWVVYAYCTNNGTATSSYSDSLTATMGWYENVTTTTTTYSNTAGVASSFYTDPSTLAPTAQSTQLSFNIQMLVAASDAKGASNWTITLTDPNSNAVKTWSGLTTTQTLTWYAANAVAGKYTWTVQAFCTNTGTGTSTYADSIAGTLGWYQSVTTTSTAYNANAGTPKSFTTPAGTLAPTALATQLTFAMSSVTAPSDAGGACSYGVTLQNPSGTTVGSWSGITAAQTLSYSNASAVAGVYTWTVQATVAESASPAAETYTCSFTGTMGWYVNTTTTTTTYANNASTSVTSVATDSTTLAPTSSSTQLSFTINSISCPSNANGATSYTVTLKNPSGTIVQTWTRTDTTAITYYNSAAPAGSWTWQVQSSCTNTGTGTSSYTTTINATVGFYENVTTTTITATNHDGSGASYRTPANTVAPTSAGTQLTLNLSSVITPSDSKGSSSIAVLLYDPNNQVISSVTRNNITAATTITYSNASAISGTYTWVVWGQCSNNDTGASSYAVSWSGTHSWYQPASSTNQVYLLASDGFTQRLSCSDSNVDFQVLTPGTVQFQITNSATVPLTFSLGVISTGF